MSQAEDHYMECCTHLATESKPYWQLPLCTLFFFFLGDTSGSRHEGHDGFANNHSTLLAGLIFGVPSWKPHISNSRHWMHAKKIMQRNKFLAVRVPRAVCPFSSPVFSATACQIWSVQWSAPGQPSRMGASSGVLESKIKGLVRVFSI